MEMKKYVSFNHKEANFRLSTPGEAVLISSIIKNRKLLDRFIIEVPDFAEALSPLMDSVLKNGSTGSSSFLHIPEIAERMHKASLLTGLGPMASVAGGFAQMAVEAAQTEAAEETVHAEDSDRIVVENGGDIVLFSKNEIILGIYPGSGKLKNRLAFRIPPTEKPMAICSSSSTMGHSLSFGKCDLAVVVGQDGFTADSGATLACNLVKTEDDIQPTLEKISTIPGIEGVLIIMGDKIGMAGKLPTLIKNADPELETKVTRDLNSGYR
ncbi:MAG: UPF0280 family protein [Spirochaetales bacterium]|nr:UPF0280 family protein [Spirochaetales bacterium]